MTLQYQMNVITVKQSRYGNQEQAKSLYEIIAAIMK